MPGLHADEARFGLASLDVLQRGIQTIHGVNHRTGAAYPWLVSVAFRLGGTSVWTLRSVGAIANLLAVALLTWSLHRYRSKRAVAFLLLIVVCSPFIVVNARVAWEVTALQFLLVSIQISILLGAIHQGRMNNGAGLAFAITSSLGVFNHFIFLSNLFAFFLSSACLYVLSASDSHQKTFASRLLHLSILTVAFAAILIVLKPIIGDAQRQWLVAVIFMVAFVLCFSSFVSRSSADFCEQMIARLCQRLAEAGKAILPLARHVQARQFGLATVITAAVIIGLMADFGGRSPWVLYTKHTWGLLGSLTSVLPLQRIMMHPLQDDYLIISHGFWIVLLGIYAWLTSRVILAAIKTKGATCDIDLIFYLYPIFAFVVLPIFVQLSSERYYLITCYLMVSCVPILLASPPSKEVFAYPFFQPKRPLAFVATGMLLLLILSDAISAQRTILASIGRDNSQTEGFTITYPGYSDTSLHFADTAKLYNDLKDQQVCRNIKANFFILEPLRFYRAIDGDRCSGNRYAQITYCESCSQPGDHFEVLVKNR